jgi:Cu2+-exporting ATPase
LTRKISAMKIAIENMKDKSSIEIVKEQFNKAGIVIREINLGQAELEEVPDESRMKELIRSLELKGFGIKTIKSQFPVTGMSCASCVARVENTLKKESGVLGVTVNLASQTAQIEYLSSIIKPLQLKKSVQSAGYDLIVEQTVSAKEDLEKNQLRRYRELRNRTIWAISLSVPLLIIGMFYMNMPYSSYVQWFLATPIVFIFGRSFYINAWKQLRHLNSNMDTLVALSTGIAYLFSIFNTLNPEFWISRGLHAHVYFEASGVVISFILLGKFLEDKAKSKTSFAIKKLMGLQPKTVNLVQADGKISEVPVAMLNAGDRILVKPGEKIAVDGRVISGHSYIDESLISGEPIPVFKEKESQIFAGTVNQQGSFQFVAEKVGAETLLASIIRLVQEAQGSKAPVQKLVDKIAGVFVPVVIVLSILTFITWSFVDEHNGVVQGVLSMITVLVIACPCALGLATPTAIMVGIGKGAEKNILIKDAEALELSYRINAMVLDKTGTLTEGKPTVRDIMWAEGRETASNKNILYNLEKASEHPLASAVVAFLKIGSEVHLLENITNHPGKGICGSFKEMYFYAGSEKLLNEQSIKISPIHKDISKQWEEQGLTVIYFFNSKEILAIVSITDKIHESAAELIHGLEKENIEVYMLTGDNLNTAKAVAGKIGLKNFQAGMLPSDKAAFVKELQRRGKIVGMVGDGINDSQALATADVSIAMGKGSDIAIDAAKMTIIGNNLAAIPMAIRLSRKTVQTIRQNLFWAFIYNLIGIPIAAGILYPINGFLLNPMIAGAAMALSSVSVVSNSLRLKWTR